MSALGAIRRVRLGRLVGVTLLLVALLHYRSDEHRPALGRWSYPHAALIVGTAGLWLLALRGSWRATRARDRRPTPPAAAVWCDVALLSWGFAYWLNALDAPANAGRLSDLNFFGSVTPAAALVEWGALVALSLSAGLALLARLGQRWLNPALSAAVVWMIALLGEGLVRVRAIVAPTTEGFPTYSGAMWSRRYVRVNHLGFRDTEHARERPPGICRLLLIGDSFAFGVGIARTQDRFGELLGGELARATGARWEVMNASRGDSHTLQEIAMLESMLAYRPDVVVLLYVFNDIDYLHPVTERSVLTEAPRTALERLHPVRVLFKNSYLFQEAYVRWRLLSRGRGAADQPYADSALVWRHFGDLARFVTEARGAGAAVGIAPFDNTVAEPSSHRRYASFVRWAAAFGLPVWRLDRALGGLPLSRLTVNTLDHHPNELANRLAAEAVVPPVLETLGTRCAPRRPTSAE